MAEKYLVTQSLLAALDWAYKTGENEDFISTLRREQRPPTAAMLDGSNFEELIYRYCSGDYQPHPKWFDGIKQIGDIVKGGQFQVKLSKDLEVDGMQFVLYGVLDVLKAGNIYDIKFSKKYENGKYFMSPQHVVYFELCDEADKFTYLVSDGEYMWKESYTRVGTPPVKYYLEDLIRYLNDHDLMETYKENWKSKY